MKFYKSEENDKLIPPSFHNAIEFKNVSFAYDEGKKNVLSNLNMKFELGKKYGLIGESGKGKTTVFKLLMGMLKNFNGNINYDGQNIPDLDKEKIIENVAYIDQNVYIFNKTIRDNICLGGNFSEEELNEAVKNSALEDFIKECEDRLDTMAEENGQNFSGGQKQRIAIARALIHKKKSF